MIAKQFVLKAQTLLYTYTDQEKAELLRIKADHLTYLTSKDLFNLYRAAKEVGEAGIEGLFIEAGCALGGSAIAIAKAKPKNRAFRIYDAFGMIPPPSDNDDADVHARYAEIKSGQSKGIDNDLYYGYTPHLQQVVADNLARHGVSTAANNIQLIKGYFEDTLVITEPVAFAHIDCDWYDSVMVCLHQIMPHLAMGGKVVFDDYYEWSGCRRAVDHYFADKQGAYAFVKRRRKLHVTKIG